ncbi:MAG: hypothetical protein OXG23_03695 [Chloroflexi bacterium]|nr:hypothetical protein [Chloroflexota bacterium]
MAEADPSLSQRVESLERISHERVVEQVVDLGERVAGLESARATEELHLATKADVARLETRIEHMQEQVGQLDRKIDARYDQLDRKFDARYDQLDEKIDARYDQLDEKIEQQSHQFQSKLDAQSHQFQSKLDAQSHQFQSKLDAQSELLQKIIEQRINRMTAWLIGTGLAIAALILSRLPG